LSSRRELSLLEFVRSDKVLYMGFHSNSL